MIGSGQRKPRTAAGIVLLGKDVQKALGADLRRCLEDRRVLDWPHPARAVPETWAAGLARQTRRCGWI